MNDNDETNKIDELSNFGELARVDGLLEEASASIDKGEYEDAISDFEQVIEITHGIFGDNLELVEVRRKIKEIQDMLEGMKKNTFPGNKHTHK